MNVMIRNSLAWGAEKSVHCELDKKMKVGKVKCSVCAEEWYVPFVFYCIF
jgi:transcription elongation factor Elf1